MTEIRNLLLHKLWHGTDPFANYPLDHRADLQGWNSDNPYLTRAIDEARPGIVVEVGVWKGLSTIAMAQRLKTLGLDGVVLAVDTFLGSSEHWLDPETFAQLRFADGYPTLFRTFAENVFSQNVQDYVLPLPVDSGNAFCILQGQGIEPTVIHLDGGHDYDAVINDLRHWWRLLKIGGILIGDDYWVNSPSWPTVRAAFRDFFAEAGELENIEGKCWVRKSIGNAYPAVGFG